MDGARRRRADRGESIKCGHRSRWRPHLENLRDTIPDIHLRLRLPGRQEAILARYILDMRSALSETSRALKPGGEAVYVIGENTIRGTFIPTARIMVGIACSVGLRVVDRQKPNFPSVSQTNRKISWTMYKVNLKHWMYTFNKNINNWFKFS